MGLWSSFCDFCADVRNKVGNAIGSGIEKIGDAVGSSKISEFGFDIRRSCNFGDSRYVSSSASSTVDVHIELKKLVDELTPQAQKAEQEIMKILKEELTDLLDELAEKDTWVPRSEIELLRKEIFSEIPEKLDGKLVGYLKQKLSLDNYDCKRVVSLSDDTERKREAREFKKKTLADAEGWLKGVALKLKKGYGVEILALVQKTVDELDEECAAREKLLNDILANNMDENALDMKRKDVLVTIEKLNLLKNLATEPYSIK
jgi:hypothetical protein